MSIGSAVAFAILVIVLGYEIALGIFPASRRIQGILMNACDSVCDGLGAEPTAKFRSVLKYPQMNRPTNRELRFWKWRPWPEMITEEELIAESVVRKRHSP